MYMGLPIIAGDYPSFLNEGEKANRKWFQECCGLGFLKGKWIDIYLIWMH